MSEQLIDAFYTALGQMQLEQCQELLQTLKERARHAPDLKNWHTYLSGVLANECEHDWAKGERIFVSLLETDLESSLHQRVLIALGVTYRRQGRWHEALDIYGQCLDILDQPDQAIDRAKVWKNMAIVFDQGFTQGELGDQALYQAAGCCQFALDAIHALEHPDENTLWLEATTWNTLGLVQRSLGDWPQAMSCFEQFIALSRALDNQYGLGAASHNLGEVLQRQGAPKWPEARQAYLQALEIYRESGDADGEIDVLANLGFLYQEMGDYAQASSCYGRAIHLIEALRAGVSTQEARAGFFATMVDTYANAVLLCLETGERERAFDLVERARSRAFLDTLAADSHNLSPDVEAATMPLAEVQAALPADALLLEYFTTGLEEVRLGPMSSRQGVQRHRFPPARTLAFAVTRDQIQIYDTGLSPNDLLPRQLDSVIERHFMDARIRHALYDHLIAPVVPLLEGKRRLYLVPHGPLHYIPFQALLAADGETLLCQDGPELVYAPSATILFRRRQKTAGPAAAACLAIGYNGDDEIRLRFAEQEARHVCRQIGGQAIAGPQLKKTTLYERAANYRMLHFSCHGTFNPQAPLTSALHLAPNEQLTALDVMAHLHLSCDLVTLSACESGLSRIRRGDELVGLMRAFLYAGARALVSTLWRVDERSTCILMERFYQEIQAGTNPARALKRAQLYLKNLTRKEAMEALAPRLGKEMANAEKQTGEEKDERLFADPFYWAPFILVGE